MSRPSLDKTKIKYQSAISIFNSEGQIQWARYNAMLLVNTALFGLTTFNLKNIELSSSTFFIQILFWLSPIFGLILCRSWYQMTNRGFIWIHHWISEANKLEDEMKGQINPVINGKEFSSKIGGGVTRKASLLIIKLFALLYFLMAINNIDSWINYTHQYRTIPLR